MPDKNYRSQLATALAAAEKLPDIYAGLEGLLDGADAIELLCQLSFMFLMHAEDEFPDPEEIGRWQVRIEFLAWMALSRPRSVPEEETVVDARVLDPLEKLFEEYFTTFAGSLMPEHVDDPQEDAANRLAYILQMEALYVRGEALQGQVEETALALYSPHDAWFVSHLGFTIADAIACSRGALEAIMKKVNDRKSKSHRLRDVAFEAYEQLVAHDPAGMEEQDRMTAEAVRAMGPGAAADNVSTSYLFTKLRESFRVSAEELVDILSGSVSEEAVLGFLTRMSQELGTADTEPNPLGFNPLARHPMIRDDGWYYVPVPPLFSEALLNTFHFDLIGDPAYKDRYDKVRSDWLEMTAIDAFATHFQTDEAYWSLSYGPTKVRTELDGLVIHDNKAILIECKWKTLTLTARQGNVEAAQADISKSILAAYSQAARARDYIRNSPSPVVFIAADGRTVEIDSSQVTEIYLVSLLGKGAMSVLAANLPRLVPLGMFGSNEYPWALSINDLAVVFEFMELPSQVFDYVKRRDAVMRGGRFSTHDEWDLLGLYLDGNLDPNSLRFQRYDRVVMPGSDSRIDQYLRSQKDEMLPRVAKPRRAIPDSLLRLLKKVEGMEQWGKSDFVIALLGMSDSTLAAIDSQIQIRSAQGLNDGQLHDFSIAATGISCGLTAVISSDDPDRLGSTVVALSEFSKYRAKADTWLGVGIDLAHSDPPHVVLYMNKPWAHDADMDEMMGKSGSVKTGHRKTKRHRGR